MSIDVLQEKIRKLKNPLIVEFSVLPEQIPPHIREGVDAVAAYARFCRELMEGLKGTVGAVRYSFSQLALMGTDGLAMLSELLNTARKLGYYVILDAAEVLTPWGAERAAEAFFAETSQYPCDGLIVSPYIGSDAIKPFIPYCKDAGKDLFLAVRTPNKSAAELQDLLTGARHVYTAAADLVSRYGDPIVGKCGYSRVGALTASGVPAVLTELRGKYKRMFQLVDGLDYPSGNLKNCCAAFDRMGHGAAISAGPAITAAWYTAETDGTDYVQQAVQAAERMRKTFSRYLTIV